MEQLTRLKARVENLHELRELMRAMRALAASHVQSAQTSLEGIRAYSTVVEDAIVEGMTLLSEVPGSLQLPQQPDGEMLIVIGSEHGFVGGLNEELASRLEPSDGPRQLGVVGSRLADAVAEHGFSSSWVEPTSTQARGVPQVARRVASRLAGAVRAELVYAAYQRGGGHTIERMAVLPFDPTILRRTPLKAPPLHHLPAEALLERLSGEYLLAVVTRAIMESFASENGARLQVMGAADRTIDTRLQKLDLKVHTLRQAAITEELLDVITGAEAIAASTDHGKAR